MVIGNRTVAQTIHDFLLVELFKVVYHRDLEMWVRGHSRSLKMVSFDRQRMTFCWSAIVGLTIAVSCNVFELFDVK